MNEFDAVILAAGLSKRMGAKNKLLLEWHGAPLIAQVVQTYVQALDGNVTVITGHEAEKLADALKELQVQIRYNAQYETGQQSSVVAALKQPSSAQSTIIGLGDQPLLTPDDLRWLMAAHRTQDPEKITVPLQNHVRGNPIIIPARLRAQILANPKSPGCRRFTRENPTLVSLVESNARGFFTDIDTPEDYTWHSQRMGGRYEAYS
ncbi:MAG: nucleotidyltransferase family protein [Pseudomonadota bacterium]